MNQSRSATRNAAGVEGRETVGARPRAELGRRRVPDETQTV